MCLLNIPTCGDAAQVAMPRCDSQSPHWHQRNSNLRERRAAPVGVVAPSLRKTGVTLAGKVRLEMSRVMQEHTGYSAAVELET